MKRLALGLAVLLSALPASAANEFADLLSCASALAGAATGTWLQVQGVGGKAGKNVGYLIEGVNARRQGIYLFRDGEAYFAPVAKTGDVLVQFPVRGTDKADVFFFSFANGHVSSYSDEIGYQALVHHNRKLAKVKKVRAVDAIGAEANRALAQKLTPAADAIDEESDLATDQMADDACRFLRTKKSKGVSEPQRDSAPGTSAE